MSDERHALIFTGDLTGGDPVLKSILEHLNISPLLPHQLSGASDNISVIIIERAASQSIKIIQNLRKQSDFARVPILVILDPTDRGLASEFAVLQTDVLFKPVAFPALRRYLETNVNAKQPAKPAPPPLPPAGSKVKEEAKKSSTGEERTVVPKKVPEQKQEVKVPPPPPQNVKKTEDKNTKPLKADVSVKVLEDLIPTSPRMMPGEIKPPADVRGGVPCPNCRRWKARKEDPVCSRCGFDLVSLEAPGEPVLFEPLGEHKVGTLVDFRNAGLNPLILGFRVAAPEQLARHFSLHTESAVLAGNTSEQLRIVLDAKGLDLATRHQATLEVTTNENGLSKREVQLVVERLPKARVYPVGSYVYALGGENFWEFGLANDGGGSLRLKSIRLDVSKDLPEGAPLEPLDTVAVKGTPSAAVRVRVPELKLPVGRHTLEVVWEFQNYPTALLRIPVEIIRPPRLVVEQTELDFGVVSATRTRRLYLTLVNTGGEDLKVAAIKSSEEWVVVIPKSPLPLVLNPSQTVTVDVEVRGAEAFDGTHQGEIEITSDSFYGATHAVPFSARIVSPEDYEEFIGIDFGTTASCVAVLDERDFRPVLLALDPAEHGDPRIMPSVLYFNQDGTVLAGRNALALAEIQPTNAVTSIKRALGLRQTKSYAGREYDATAITSKIIEQLLHRTEEGLFRLGEYKTPRQAVVTVPIEFNNSQRRALLEACRAAGLDMPDTSQHGVVIDEAHAAALYYLSKKSNDVEAEGPEKVLIFDFGGGTLDCALVEIERVGSKMVLRTLAPGGSPRLGGEDIDWALVGLLADKAKQTYSAFDLNCLGDEQKFEHLYRIPEVIIAAYRTRSRFKRQAESAKIALTEIPRVEFKIEPLFKIGATPFEPYLMNGLGMASFDVTLTREELQAVLEPFVVAAERVVQTLCERARVRLDEVQTILHVGRTSKLPLVRERINALLPNATDHSELVEPKLCVALGAAFWGYIKDHPDSNFEFVGVGNQLIHDLGYITLDGMQEVFRSVFAARTEYPSERVLTFPRKDFINIRLAENRGKNPRIRDNAEISRIGAVRIDTRGLNGDEVPVVFRINDNQILEIIANNHRQAIELD